MVTRVVSCYQGRKWLLEWLVVTSIAVVSSYYGG